MYANSRFIQRHCRLQSPSCCVNFSYRSALFANFGIIRLVKIIYESFSDDIQFLEGRIALGCNIKSTSMRGPRPNEQRPAQIVIYPGIKRTIVKTRFILESVNAISRVNTRKLNLKLQSSSLDKGPGKKV